MNKYDQLRLHIQDRIKQIQGMQINTNIYFAKETELCSIIKLMDQLDNQEKIDNTELDIVRNIKSVNESLSEAAELEWQKEKETFYYHGIPDFDKRAFEEILREKGIISKAA